MIKRLEKEGKISEKEYELIYARDSRPGILYGSPKFHKPVITNCPKLRPILSTISVHDLFSFADEVSSFCRDHLMASLGVERLFTNVALNEVIDICIDDLFCDTNTIHNLDRNGMKKLLTL